jgi:hypothetical protein
MNQKTKLSIISIFLILTVFISTVSAATCTNVKITGLTVTPVSGIAPVKPSYSATVVGECSKVTYTVTNSAGKKVCAASGTCGSCSGTKKCSVSCATITTPGTYYVSATAYGKGCTYTFPSKVAFTVKAASPATCVPSFSYKTYGNRLVAFRDTTAGVISCKWDMNNDGKFEISGCNPVVRFTKTGHQTVCMEVICKSCNCPKKVCKDVIIK